MVASAEMVASAAEAVGVEEGEKTEMALTQAETSKEKPEEDEEKASKRTASTASLSISAPAGVVAEEATMAEAAEISAQTVAEKAAQTAVETATEKATDAASERKLEIEPKEQMAKRREDLLTLASAKEFPTLLED